MSNIKCDDSIYERVINDISEDSIDYTPHGNFTVLLGGDCLHSTDI